MNKFWTLLKKEVKEMLTPQVLLPMLLTVAIFIFIGKVAGSEIDKAKKAQDIIVVDLDQSATSKAAIAVLSKGNVKIKAYEKDGKELIDYAKSNNISTGIVFPDGFEKGIREGKVEEIKTYSVLKNFSLIGTKDAAMLDVSIATINEFVSSMKIVEKNKELDPLYVKNPIKKIDNVVIGNKSAEVNAASVMSFITSQIALIPVVLFMVIIFAATMIATAIATEKENKTLETLLTAPVKRNYIVLSKMMGSGVVALLSAVIYLFGFRYYINGLSGDAGNINSSMKEIAFSLGLTFDLKGYLLLGAVLFLAILCALAIATIIGAFAEDSKSVNGLISPLMVLIMIPYFLTMFLDINSLSPALKALVYAIPFSYPFLASPNIFLHNYTPLIYGMIYQIIVFIIFVAIAAKIFSTDKIVTLKLNFNKKRAK